MEYSVHERKKDMFERIYVEIGNVCNLACSFCAGTNRPARQMTEAEFSLVCARVRSHTKYIYLHVMGEPLLHPSLDAFLHIAREAALPVCITTNGTLLRTRGEVLLAHADGLHKVSVSLHAPEGNGERDMSDYLQDVVAFAHAASARGIYVVLRLWNRDSAEGAGANTQNGAIEDYLRHAFSGEWQRRPRGYRVGRNTFLEYDGLFTWPGESTADEVEEGFCHGLSAQVAILADGTVVPCCLDANGEIPLGNIFETSLEDIVLSARARAIRDGFAAGRMTEPLCRRCTFARRFRRRGG